MKVKMFLKKYNKIIIIITVLVFIIFSFYEFALSKEIAKSATNKYLQILNINRHEVKSIKIYYSFKLGSQYDILIKYKNEPNLKYWYNYIIRENKFFIDDIINENTSIALVKKIKPLHETPRNIKLLISEKYSILEDEAIKYTLFDYIKDFIKNK